MCSVVDIYANHQPNPLLQDTDGAPEHSGRTAIVTGNTLRRTRRWLTKLALLGKAIAAALKSPMSPKNDIRANLMRRVLDLTDGESLYLYLVDEATMRLVTPQDDRNRVYPIKIEHNPGAVLQSLLPLFRATIKAVSLVTGPAGLLEAFGCTAAAQPSASAAAAAAAASSHGVTRSLEPGWPSPYSLSLP